MEQKVLMRPVETRKPATHEFLGIPFLSLSLADTVSAIHEAINRRTFSFLVTLNTYGLVLSLKDPEFRDVLLKADIITPDGGGILLGAKLLGIPIHERVSGIDLISEICKLCIKENYSVFLLGGKEEHIQLAKQNLEKDFPELRISGIRNGYFADRDEPEITGMINEAKPDILLVGFGMPKQEKWMHKHREALSVPFCMGVGGSFDVLSGKLNRAPVWMQNAGLEWLYRVLQEPKRLPRLWVIPYYFYVLFTEKMRRTVLKKEF